MSYTRKDTRTLLCCPDCGEDMSTVDHLFDADSTQVRRFGPWYCDNCLVSVSGKILGEEVVEVTTGTKASQLTQVIRAGHFVLARETLDYGRAANAEERLSDMRYYVEEHTCPENLLGGRSWVLDASTGEFDPHGIFELVGILEGGLPEEDEEAEILREQQVLGLLQRSKPLDGCDSPG